jgi:hypothetical protein
MAKKVPTIPPLAGDNMDSVVRALVGVVSYTAAQQQPAVQLLSPSATLADVIAKLNEIINRVQGQ